MTLIKKELRVDVKEFDIEQGTLRAVFSSGLPDRQDEMIDQSSWILDEFLKNPVVLWSHNSYELPIGRVETLGLNSEGMLEGVIRFAIKEYEFAKTIFDLYVGRFLRAFSVGFTNDEYEEVQGIRVLKNPKLLEISAVNIPADALALAKSKGVDISSLMEKKQEEQPKAKPEPQREPEVLTEDNKVKIKKAISVLEDVLKVDKPKQKKRKNVRKILNSAVRELLKVKKVS